MPPSPTSPDAAPAPTQPVAPVGIVTSPANGQLFTGLTTQTAITVAGTYTGSSSSVSVQVLSDPNDLTSWTTIGAAAVVSEAFATTVGPFDNLQWPQGGVLRLRVVDASGAALAYEVNNDTDQTRTTIVVGSPGQNPTDWQFLTQKPQGTVAETQLYYQQIAAPATLSAFESTFGLSTGTAIAARYYNRNDLGIAREAQCAATTLGGVACTVRNFGSFGGSESAALSALEHGGAGSTFAMLYTPPATAANAVTFMVYDASGRLAGNVQLDTAGNNISVPQSCLNCHGAQSTYDAGGHAATGALLLPFDPLAMDFPTDDTSLTFVAQQSAMFQLDQLLNEAAPTPAQSEVIAGEWQQTGAFNSAYVPGAWSTTPRDANLYAQVIAPFCRGCHSSVADDSAGLAFRTPADLTANASKVAAEICGAGPNGMPVAQQTSSLFFDATLSGTANPSQPLPASARALLLEYLDQPGACAQGQFGQL